MIDTRWKLEHHSFSVPTFAVVLRAIHRLHRVDYSYNTINTLEFFFYHFAMFKMFEWHTLNCGKYIII